MNLFEHSVGSVGVQAQHLYNSYRTSNILFYCSASSKTTFTITSYYTVNFQYQYQYANVIQYTLFTITTLHAMFYNT